MPTVLSTPDTLLAQQAVELLASHGIEAQIVDHDTLFGGALAGGRQYAIVVTDGDASRAHQVLASRPAPLAAPAGAWRCPACQEAIEATFDACWHCGAPRGDHPEIVASVPQPEEPPQPLRIGAPGDSGERDLAATAPESRGMVWVEVALVLCFGWLGTFLGGFAMLWDGTPKVQSKLMSLADMVWSLGNCGLVAFLLLRAGRPWLRHGLARPRALDLGLGLVVLVLAIGIEFVFWRAMSMSGAVEWLDALYAPVPNGLCPPFVFGASSIPLAVVCGIATTLYLLVVAAVEEFVFRAYLLPRLADLLGSRLVSTLISTTLFASSHAYQGAYGIVSAFVFGLMMAAGFWLIGRVWPLVLAHAVWNMMLGGLVH